MKIYFGYSLIPVNRNLPVLRTNVSPVSFMHIQDKRQFFRWAHSYSDNLVGILALCIVQGSRHQWRNSGMVEVLYLPQEKPGSLPMPGPHSTSDRITPRFNMKVRLFTQPSPFQGTFQKQNTTSDAPRILSHAGSCHIVEVSISYVPRELCPEKWCEGRKRAMGNKTDAFKEVLYNSGPITL